MAALRQIGRYAIYDAIAEGGMATVHFGRQVGDAGFSKTVAIKTLHPEYVRDRDFVAMFLDEVRIAARIAHPNVPTMLDVVFEDRELFLVMEYVHGEALARLLKAARKVGEPPPAKVASGIVCGVLRALHAAHEALDENGEPLSIIHRDVSPHNIIVGSDGLARVIDFGVAKVAGQLQSTRKGYVKGKLGYMAPEQLAGDPLDRRADVYAAGVVLFETLTGERLRDGGDESVVYAQVATAAFRSPSDSVPDLPDGTDAVVLRALAKEPDERYPTAAAFADALEELFGAVLPSDVGRWVHSHAAEVLQWRSRVRQMVEADSIEQRASSHPGVILESVPDPETGSVRIVRESGSYTSKSQSKATVPTVRSVPTYAARQKKRLRLWLGFVAVCAGAIASLLVFGIKNDTTPSSNGVQTDAIEPPQLVGSAPMPTDVSTGSPPAVTVEPLATAASASADGAHAEPPAASASSAQPKPPGRLPPRPPRQKLDCDPPYVINAEGTKRYKSQCL